MKVAKTEVGYEHPAKGVHHCGQCRHFIPAHGCHIVRGHINSEDWCQRFKRRSPLYDNPRSPR